MALIREHSARSRNLNVLKLLVLLYADPVSAKGKSYDAYQGDASRDNAQLSIRPFVSSPLVSIPPFTLENSADVCNARLHEVGE